MESHLLQMRGLKRCCNARRVCRIGSHLLQMRGLKQGAAYAKTLAESRIFYRCVD